MITISDYLKWYDLEYERMMKSGHFASKPVFLFERTDDTPEYWEFNRDNWNGGDIIRRWLYEHWQEVERVGNYTIKFYWDSDQSTVFLFADNEWFEFSWYKQRGRTEKIERNGHPIDLGDYIALCNVLRLELEVIPQ